MSEVIAWAFFVGVFAAIFIVDAINKRAVAEQARRRELERDGLAPHKVRL